MKSQTLIFLIACAFGLGIIISYSGRYLNAIYVAINIILSLVTVSVIYLMYSFSESARKDYKTADEFMKGIGRVSYYQASKIPLSKSLRKAAKSCPDQVASGLLYKIAQRMDLGGGVFDAMTAVAKENPRINRILTHGTKTDFNFNEAFSFYQSNKKEQASKSVSISTRYATLNMFLSTVAPSFIIFSFIGSMLMSTNGVNIEFMAFSLTTLIPIIYSISNSMLNRRLFG